MNDIGIKLGAKPLEEAIEDEDLSTPGQKDVKVIGRVPLLKDDNCLGFKPFSLVPFKISAACCCGGFFLRLSY